MTRKTVETELGTEIQCSRCKGFFPADNEFFYRQPSNKYNCHSHCKACYLQDLHRRRASETTEKK